MESMVSYYSKYIYSIESFQQMLVAKDFLPTVERIITNRLGNHFRRHSSNHSWTSYNIFLFVGMSILHFIIYLESTMPYELDWSYFITGKRYESVHCLSLISPHIVYLILIEL